jgi:hypothetical protein
VQKHRLTVDIPAGIIRPDSVETVQLVPGELHFRQPAGDFAQVKDPFLLAGDRHVWTGLHDSLAETGAVAAAELRKRGEHLLDLAKQCEELEGASNG